MLRSRSLLKGVQTLSRPTSANARYIHGTPAALKKKGKAAAKTADEDGFDDAFGDDDLFGGVSSSQSKAESVVAKPVANLQKPGSNTNAKAAKRAAMFEAERAELASRLTHNRGDGLPRAKKTAIRSILRWADTPAHLETVKDLVADMRKSKIGLHEDTAKEFFGRCVSLNRPDIALQVLTNRPCYRLDLDLNTARDLLHSIFIRVTQATPFAKQMIDEWKPFTASHHQDALLLAGLYPHFQLGEATQDPISSTLLMSMFTAQRSTPLSELPQEEGMETYGDVAKALGKDLLRNTRRNQLAHLLSTGQQTFSHRHQVWLDSELQRGDVQELLKTIGFTNQNLTSLGVSEKSLPTSKPASS